LSITPLWDSRAWPPFGSIWNTSDIAIVKRIQQILLGISLVFPHTSRERVVWIVKAQKMQSLGAIITQKNELWKMITRGLIKLMSHYLRWVRNPS
jgi:hypothetical protein